MPGTLPQTLEDLFNPGGRLSELIPSFEYRPQQLELAEAATRIFEKGGSLLAEVGTGTGKTLGYLVPAVISGRQTIISTGTKNLQEQIFNKDIPLLRKMWPGLKGAILKGRANYLCRRRLADAMQKPFLPGSREAEFLNDVASWAGRTITGDRAELDWISDDESLWAWVSAEHEACLSSRCPLIQECFITRARKAASAADLVVVNHYLLMAEAALGGTGGGLMPEGGILVVDEAHLLEEIATRNLGMEASSGYLARFFAEASSAASGMSDKKAARLARRGFEMLDALGRSVPPEEGSFLIQPEPLSGALVILGGLGDLLCRISAQMEKSAPESPEVEYLSRLSSRYSEAVTFICGLSDSSFIYWYEKKGTQTAFYSSPVDVSGELPRLLFDRYRSVLLTSATLAVGGNFGYMKRRLGLERADELIADSPFDYRRQAVLYIPRDLPVPNAGGFPEAVVGKVIPLLELTDGRAFILCTSRRNLEIIQKILKDKTDFKIIRQGDAPRSTLLKEFVESPRAVLVATTSFWQGVDVPGEALSAVVVDRLPFASPDDPITRGRIDHISDRGGNPFGEYQLPSAVIMLKQGLGRLIRRKTDHGLLAVMDTRITSRAYGRVFLSSLPSMRIVEQQKELEEAYHALAGQN